MMGRETLLGPLSVTPGGQLHLTWLQIFPFCCSTGIAGADSAQDQGGLLGVEARNAPFSSTHQ